MTPETRSGRGGSLVGSMLERRYRVDSLIARGGMSTVYRGLDTRLDRPVALKVMDARYSGDRSFIGRFKREAQAAASLHHPNVVAVYDQGVDRESDDEYVYLVMQLVEGCTLRDLLHDQGQLSLPLALSILEPVLAALAAAHRAGMVHRDIKPENVLLGQNGSVLVADFGLVRAAASAGTTSGSVILGTVAYLSPEQVTTGAADARTDVYAAGIVLYEMLTGAPPYTGDTALSVAYRHVNDDVPAPSEQLQGIPPSVDALVLRATRRDSSVRPADAETLLAQVQGVRSQLGLEPVAIPVPATEEPTALTPLGNDDPPTDTLPSVPAEQPSSGPRGTMAISRDTEGDDQTQDLPAVSDSAARDRGRRRRLVGIWTSVVLVLAFLVGGVAWWLGSSTQVSVPGIAGKQEALAINLVQGADLVPEVQKEYHNSVPEGTVISSQPSQGSEVDTGATIDLVVSRGRPQVPEIEQGATVEQAERLLRDARLRPQRDDAANEYHRTVPEGQVIGVNPAQGTRLEISSQVTLRLSKGPPPVPVPDVRGASKQDAFAALRAAGFEPYEAGRQFDRGVQGDHVITTNPTPGTEVRLRGAPRVGVIVSNAVTVPDLTGKSVQEAEQEVLALGLRFELRSILGEAHTPVLGQFPIAGTKVRPGAVVHGTAF